MYLSLLPCVMFPLQLLSHITTRGHSTSYRVRSSFAERFKGANACSLEFCSLDPTILLKL